MTRNHLLLAGLLLLCILFVGYRRMAIAGAVTRGPIPVPAQDQPLPHSIQPARKPSSREDVSGERSLSSSASKASPTPKPATRAAQPRPPPTTRSPPKPPATPNPFRSPSIPRRSATAPSYASSSRRARSHAAQPPGSGCRDQLPFRHLLSARRQHKIAAAYIAATGRRACLQRQDRHRAYAPQGLLQGRRLPPGLRHQEPQ